VPSTDPDTAPTDKQLTEQVLRFLGMLGFDPAAVGGSLVVTPSCGLAGATTTYARAAVRQARAVASHLS
jgi:hypothetical protein